MSMLAGFKKVRRRIRLPDGYKLLSFWTSSQSVEMDDGTTLESNAEWMKSILDRCNKSKGTYTGNIDSLCNSSHNGSYWVTPQASGNKPASTYFGLITCLQVKVQVLCTQPSSTKEMVFPQIYV